jgi:hypothetical protein
MKKTTIFLLIIIFSFNNLFAVSRDSDEAHQLAQHFFNSTTNSGIKKAPTATASVQLVFSKARKSELSSNYYYIFNQANNQGFVIISGDEKTNEILGYSDENNFDPQNIPDNLKYWLSVYEMEMDNSNVIAEQKTKEDISAESRVKNSSSNLLAAVSPLLGGIKWNQDSPYNDLCPIINSTTNKRAVSGCVATGMAQVMKYYQWPVTGTGSNTYTSTTYSLVLTLDFSQTTFDWANMTETYSSSSSATEKNAVATLMYNCGVAVNMDYAESSGASSKTAAKVLISNFGYDSNIQYISRDYYTRAEWQTMLKEELSAARPVLYSGSTGTSGHYFVCDGYDNNNFFHFNWGWGGSSNGYFRISALDPTDQGIGGGVDGYNNYQSITTGIQKPNSLSTPKYLLFAGDTLTYPASSVTRNASFELKVNALFNKGINSFTGKVGLALYDNNDNYISDIKVNSVSNLSGNYGWNTLSFKSTTIGSSVVNGNYKIYCVYKPNSELNWQIVRTPVGTPNYIQLNVTTSTLEFSSPTNERPVLQLNSLTQTGNFYNNKLGRINASITNNGKEYNSLIKLKLQSTTDNNAYQIVSSKAINIAEGETKELNFNDSVKLVNGDYTLSVLYSARNLPSDNNFVQLGNSIPVSVIEIPTGSPVLTLNSKISFPDASKVDKNMAVLTAQITNSGGPYDKKLIAFIFPKTGGNSLKYIGYQTVILDQNETRNIIFQGAINLPLTDYFVAVYYQNSLNAWTRVDPTVNSKEYFTLVDSPTAISNIELIKDLVVFPNPATNHFTIQSSNTIRSYRIFNLLGEELLKDINIPTNEQTINVSSFKSGTYIVRIDTESGIHNLKFIKQ